MRERASGWWSGVAVLIALTASAEARAGEFAARPHGTKVRVDAPNAIATRTEPFAGPPLVLFVNRCQGGITLTPGQEDDSSANVSMILDGPLQLAEYPYGDAQWAQIVSGVQEIFAPFNVIVTDQDPSPMPHDEAIVCGRSEGTTFEGAAGVAPYTCGQIPNAITYTFPETIGNDLRFTIETIAQEAAHAWGLDHSYKCEDPMTYLEGCGNKAFQDGDFPCGEYSARACDCSGQPTQNTYQHILNTVGPAQADGAPPSVSITAPTDGATFTRGDDFRMAISASDDTGVASVELYLDGTLIATDAQAPFDGWPMNDSPLGSYEFYVRAVDRGGNEGFSETITVQITADGLDPEDPDEGGSSGGEDFEDEEEPGDTDGVDTGVPGGVPFAQPTPRDQGCGCTVGADEDSPWFLGVFLLAGALRRRRA